jgi:hypothetical protein
MPARFDRFEDPRRAFLIRALAAGVFAAGGPFARAAGPLGDVPERLPAGRSVYRLGGFVTVNGNAASEQTRIAPTDRIETGPDGHLIFAVGDDAFLVRRSSNLQLEPDAGGTVTRSLRLLTGALLSVFGAREHQISTPVATIGIRGTGLYVESTPEESYVCTCYGETMLAAVDDPSVREDIATTHHDAPRYILAAGASGERIRQAPFKNHTDEELQLLEALVGRTPPFVFGDAYDRPRRRDY